MTTIVCRDGIIAADTGMTCGATVQIGIRKIAKRGGSLAGACGNVTYMAAFLAWFEGGESGAPPEAASDDNGVDIGVIYRSNNSIEVYERGGKCVITPNYYACGSGRDQALGAMFVGSSAEMAVRASISHDAYTNGDVLVLRRND